MTALEEPGPARVAGADDERALLDGVPRELLIGGTWRPAADGATFEVSDPATGVVLAAVADAGIRDGIDAVTAAHAAGAAWAAQPARDRSDTLRRAFELLRERREDLALLMTLEMGKPLVQARGEVDYAAEYVRWYAEEAVRIRGTVQADPGGDGQIAVVRRPVGVAVLVTPWNFPLAMAARKIAPALAAGCTVVVKPAPQTPLTTLTFAALLTDAGVPTGAVNVVTTTDAPAVVAAMLEHPRTRKLSFTGSTAVGRALLVTAAGNVLRTSMELGGNAPFLVFEDADLDAAVRGALVAKLRNMGQACTAANRFLVHETLAERFADRLADAFAALRLGRGTDPAVDVGPLIDATAVRRVEALVHDAVHDGARLRFRAPSALARGGHFVAPTVLTDVPAHARILDEEIFGPVAPVVAFGDDDEAVGLANATQYGLVAYAYTADPRRATRLARELETGMVALNRGTVANALAPFGGVKHSGFGREGGSQGIDEYLETVYVAS